MHVESHHTAERLAELVRVEPHAKVARRLAAVRLALLGHTAPQIAERVFLSERQVRTWVARYNLGGPDALADRPGRGRKGPLASDQEDRLKDRLRAGPTDPDGVCTLRGQDVRRILVGEFGVLRSLQAVYDLLHRLGFELQRRQLRQHVGRARQERGVAVADDACRLTEAREQLVHDLGVDRRAVADGDDLAVAQAE